MNAVDLGVIAVLILSAIIAFARGFTREALAIAGWLAAVFVTVYGFDRVKPYAEQYVDPPWLADTVAGAGLFLVTLLVATIISRMIANRVQSSVLGPVDRSLGFAFGLLRGAVILCVAYLLMIQILPAEERPEWVMAARARPYVEQGAFMLLDLAPPAWREKAMQAIENASDEADAAVENKALLDSLLSPGVVSTDGAGGADMGYRGTDRKELERLLETTR